MFSLPQPPFHQTARVSCLFLNLKAEHVSSLSKTLYSVSFELYPDSGMQYWSNLLGSPSSLSTLCLQLWTPCLQVTNCYLFFLTPRLPSLPCYSLATYPTLALTNELLPSTYPVLTPCFPLLLLSYLQGICNSPEGILQVC